MDPNGIVGTPRDIWVWLAPDWSDWREGERSPASGWTRVKIRETLYNDGRIVRHVLDANGQPVKPDGTPAETPAEARPLDSTPQYDKNQQQRWKDQQAQAGRGDQEGDTRGPQNLPQREVYRGGKWVLEPNPLYQAGTTRRPDNAAPRIEGTPIGTDAQGNTIYDNERPIKVWRTPDGQQHGPVEELSADERKRWEEDRQRSRNPDGKTDAQVEAERKEAEAREQRNQPKTEIVTINGQRYTVTVTPGQNGQPPKVEWRNPAGQVMAQPPVEAGKPHTETVTINGQRYTRVTTTAPDGTVTIKNFGPDGKEVSQLPQEGDKAPLPANYPKYTPDWSHPDGDLGITAYAREVRGRTDLTKEQQDQLIKEAHGAASTVVSRGDSTIRTQEGTRTAAITQRGQDVQLANQRMSTAGTIHANAVSQAADQTKYSTGPDALALAPYYLALGMAAAQAMGGLYTPPQVGNGPAIQQTEQMGLPGRGAPAVPGLATVLGGGPWAGAPATSAPPSAAEVEAQRQATMAASQAAFAGAGVPPTPPPMTREQAMANPAFRPTPRPGETVVPRQEDGAPTSLTGGTTPWFTPTGPAAPSPVASMLGGGPWQEQAAAQPTGALGVQMARSAGGYDPSPINQAWLEAGVDPEIVRLFDGGVG